MENVLKKYVKRLFSKLCLQRSSIFYSVRLNLLIKKQSIVAGGTLAASILFTVTPSPLLGVDNLI